MSAEDVTFQHTMHFQRDFPVPYDIVVENIGDQSHVPFAHHGVAGSRYGHIWCDPDNLITAPVAPMCLSVHHTIARLYFCTSWQSSKGAWLVVCISSNDSAARPALSPHLPCCAADCLHTAQGNAELVRKNALLEAAVDAT